MDRLPPVFAARTRIVLIALVAGLAAFGAGAAPAQVSQPTVTLLAPGNGTLVEGAVTFSWRVDSAAPVSGAVAVTHQVASDIALTQDVTTTTRQCAAGNPNCWTTFKPSRAHAGRRYWRVSVSGAATATSRTWMFMGVSARATPDRVRPRVRAYPGAGRRGRKAVFVARVADDRGEARMQVDLAYRNQPVFRTATLLKPVRWSVKQRFDSRFRLARSLHPGAYRFCVTAWDRTGNRAKSCARYTVR
jgi:hypothetical protein